MTTEFFDVKYITKKKVTVSIAGLDPNTMYGFLYPSETFAWRCQYPVVYEKETFINLTLPESFAETIPVHSKKFQFPYTWEVGVLKIKKTEEGYEATYGKIISEPSPGWFGWFQRTQKFVPDEHVTCVISVEETYGTYPIPKSLLKTDDGAGAKCK